MAIIKLKGIGHFYPGESNPAIRPLDLTFESGGAYALLGPSGCGKTTLLKILSGLLIPTEGSIYIDDIDVTHCSPRERNLAQVFQFPVLYENMTVFENLSFPLRNQRPALTPKQQKERIEKIATLLELTPYLKNFGGQLPLDLKQLVSLARGLVRQDRVAILLDEPLTVVSAEQKTNIRRKLKEVHREMNVTLIYVTHDQMEAMTFANQVLVMKDGRILQQGTPQELFESPAHPFVGHFIGRPGMNFFRDPATKILMGIRPRSVDILPPNSVVGDNDLLLFARIAGVEYLGSHTLWKCVLLENEEKISSNFFQVLTSQQQNLKRGDQINLRLPLSQIKKFPEKKEFISP